MAVAKQVSDTMNTLAKRFPSDLAYTVFFDSTVFVTTTIVEVIRTLVIAIVLVGLVVFLFLGKLRTTLIPLIAVPVSVVGTFAVLLLIGYSANTVSLLALVLAIGIVVDDAIVVVENIERVIEEEPELSVPEACKKAMAEITGPILAITFVLLAVFVPVAFIPGLSGQLFRQFAVAVSVSMLISALNALTLSPALCAVLLVRGQSSRGPMRYVLGAIDKVRDGYVGVVRRLVGVSLLAVVVVAGVLASSFLLFRHTPQSFLPDEDQGAIFAALRLPEGASLNRTEAVVKQVEDIVRPIPGVEGILSVVGLNFIDYVASSNQAFFVIRLKPYDLRADASESANAIIARLRPQLAAIQGAVAFPFNLPPILGLGSTGGFQYVLEALQGQAPTDVAAVLRGVLVAANQQPELAGVFSTYAADTPQIYLDIDRDKAQVLGVKISDIFNALQSTLGSYYINDFNVFGRTWQVNLQAETQFRDRTEDIARIYVRNAAGGAVPIRALAEVKLVQGPQTVVRYNGYRGAVVNGAAKPGYSSGQALAAMQRMSADDAAGRLQLRMDRHRVSGKGRSRQHLHRARRSDSVCLSVSGRLVRKLERPGAGAAVGQRRHIGRAGRDSDRRIEFRCLRANRARRPDRARSQERHPDRRLRDRAERARQGRRGRRHRGRGASIPSGDDDELRFHFRAVSAGDCPWRGGSHPPSRGHAGVRRHDRRGRVRDFPCSASFCGCGKGALLEEAGRVSAARWTVPVVRR